MEEHHKISIWNVLFFIIHAFGFVKDYGNNPKKNRRYAIRFLLLPKDRSDVKNNSAKVIEDYISYIDFV